MREILGREVPQKLEVAQTASETISDNCRRRLQRILSEFIMVQGCKKLMDPEQAEIKKVAEMLIEQFPSAGGIVIIFCKPLCFMFLAHFGTIFQ